jgi:hypothetical protein
LRNILPPHRYPEDSGIFLQNINNHTKYYTHSHSRSSLKSRQSQKVCSDHIRVFFLGIPQPSNEEVYRSQPAKVLYSSEVAMPSFFIMILSSMKSLELAADTRV